MVVVFAARHCNNPLLLLLLLLFDFVVVCFVCSSGSLFQVSKRGCIPLVSVYGLEGHMLRGGKEQGSFVCPFSFSFLSNPLADKSIAAVCKAAAVLCVERFHSVDVDSGFLH